MNAVIKSLSLAAPYKPIPPNNSENMSTLGTSGFLHYEGSSSKWARLKFYFDEQLSDGTVINHHYAPLINLKNGDIYFDCSRKKIYTKLAVNTLLRPLHTVFKTLTHIFSILSTPYKIYATYTDEKYIDLKGKEIAILCLKDILHSFTDVFRTPIYGTALTITSLAGLFLVPLAYFYDRNLIYDIRETMDNMISNLYRETSNYPRSDFMPCLQAQFTYDVILEKYAPSKSKIKKVNKTPFEMAQMELTEIFLIYLRNPTLSGRLNPFQTYIKENGRLMSPAAYAWVNKASS